MRIKFVLPALVLALAAPAAAEPRAQEKLDRAGDALSSPIAQELAAAQMTRMLSAILDIRLEPFAKAIEPLDGGRAMDRMEGRTLGDVARDDDPYFDERLADGTRRAVGSAGAMAKGLAAAMPELERAMRRLKDSLPVDY